MSQNLAQTRVVDPILSTHCQGYRHPANVGHLLFPRVNVGQYGGSVIEFGKESFRLVNAERAPGANTRRIEVGYVGKPYAIVEKSLEAVVPFSRMRDASQVPQVDLAKTSVNTIMKMLDLGLENKQATISRTAGNYDAQHKVTLAGATLWSAATGKPSDDIETAKQAIRTSIGMEPNLVLLSATSFAKAKYNANVVPRFQYTGRDSITPAMLAALWDVEQVAVGKAVYASGQNDVLGDVWGNDTIVAYVAPQGDGIDLDLANPSYGYTYTIDGMPLVEMPYQDRNAKGWVYPVTADREPVLSGIVAGYLIKDSGL